MSEFFSFNDIFLYHSMSTRRRKNKFNGLLVKFNSMLCKSGLNVSELSAQRNELVVYTIPDEEYDDLVKTMNFTSYYVKDRNKKTVHEHLFRYLIHTTYL